MPTEDGGTIIVDPNDIQREGDVGVVEGFYQPPWPSSPDAEYNYCHGLVIFFYEGDDIVDYIFIPFDLLLTNKGVNGVIDFIEEHDIDWEDFDTALERLEEL